jgi:hypothetical protein
MDCQTFSKTKNCYRNSNWPLVTSSPSMSLTDHQTWALVSSRVRDAGACLHSQYWLTVTLLCRNPTPCHSRSLHPQPDSSARALCEKEQFQMHTYNLFNSFKQVIDILLCDQLQSALHGINVGGFSGSFSSHTM